MNMKYPYLKFFNLLQYKMFKIQLFLQFDIVCLHHILSNNGKYRVNTFKDFELVMYQLDLLFHIAYLQILVQMRPSPFTGKFKRKEIKPNDKDKNQDKQEQAFEEHPPTIQNNVLRPPSTKNMIKIGKSKDRDKSKEKQPDTKKIYDALKDEDEGQKLQSKASATFKPNLKLLKGGKKLKLSTHQNGQNKKQQQPQQQSYRPVLKPNLFKKGETINSQRAQKQQIIIDEQHRNGQTNVEQDSHQSSVGQSQSISIAPKFKIKNKQQQPNFPVIHEQPMEQTGFGVTNFADLKIQTREINLDTSEVKISEVKVQKQQARVRDLSKMLNLEEDLYEQMLNISCVTPYQIYINKIKSGSLINSSDQAFDEKSSSATQTSTLQYQDFTNQCPQDYHTDATNIVQDETESFNRFIARISPVLQELIKPSTTVVMPPIFLLALRPEFRKFVTIPYPLFVYFSTSLQVGVVVVGEKLYIAEGQIQSVTAVGGVMVAGGSGGELWVWGGGNDKRSRLYRRVLQQTQTTNFELPQASNHEQDRFSIYRSHHPIKSLLTLNPDTFLSLDQSCKLTKWRIIRTPSASATGSSIKLQAESSHEFGSILQKNNIIGYDIKRRNQMFFINSSAGILVWNGDQIVQRLDVEGFRVFGYALPFRTGFLYAVCEDQTVRIYDEHYANQLYKLHLPGHKLIDIFIPQTQYQNKKLSQTSKLYITTSQSKILSINLLQSTSEIKQLTKDTQKKERDIIYKGVNKLIDSFQIICLWKDLKCTTQIKKMDTNIEATVGNVKNILEDNRLVHGLLEAQSSLMLVE